MIMELIISRLLIIAAAISFLLVFLSNMIKFNAACNPREREALLNFKHNLKDPHNELSSWVVGNDCCKWNGVFCSENITEGDVVQLQLRDFWLSGELMNSSLLELKHLYHLDLSFNNFYGRQILAFLCSLQNLQYLNLLGNSLAGNIPPQLGNLSSLYYLDLSFNKLEGEIPRTLGNLCNLEVLFLSINKLQGEISSLLFTNSSICSASKLKSLNLGYNHLLSGRLPDELGSLENLQELYLAGNSFSGSIPTSLGRLSILRVLDLSENKLNGSLPETFGNLSSLQELRISNISICQSHFLNLTRLEVLDIDSSVLKVSHDWVPPFQLQEAQLRDCSVGHGFPEWLRTQRGLLRVDVSNARISGSVPSWFWNMTSQLEYLNISHNQLEGDLSNVLLKTNSSIGRGIYLNSNRFTGNLPLISSHVEKLDLSRNSFSGPISVLLCSPTEHLNHLAFLDLSGNLLSGELSDCWFYWTSLVLISLENNNITGNIPSSIGFLLQLQTLRLQNNSLDGELPPSLRDCAKLRIIDLGENRLVGRLPTWIGESFKELVIMRLHLNMFYGEIPRELCYLNMLQILDMGHNNLSGSIPRCFRNFSKMGSKFYPNIGIYNYYVTGKDTTMNFAGAYLYTEMKLVVKGKEWLYGDILLNLVAAIDLSNNNLDGEIPEELTYLFRLLTLNLANNSLIGTIPNKIGLLSLLESLDLSNNRLSGSIPQSMVNLTFLGYLNLSYNNLSGKIPQGNQLGTFPESNYIGNHDLCGSPLKECDQDGQRQKAPNGDDEGSIADDEDWIEMKWFYMGLPLGFVVGFWCLWGVLLVKSSWRYAYFRFLDDIIYKLSPSPKQKKK